MTSETHWMVFCPERGPATVKHTRKADAKEEAERISAKEGKIVFVFQCECIGYYVTPQKPEPKWTALEGR